MDVLQVIFFLREYLFPSGCAVCGARLINMQETWYGLCGSCRADLGEVIDGLGERCGRCGKPLISEQDYCLSCRDGETPSFDRVRVLFPYTGKCAKVLLAYKFGRQLAPGNFFAEKVRQALEGFGEPGAALPEIVPVPPRAGKIKKTGWDQVEYLTRLLERGGKGGLKINRCLKRLPSRVQKELNREERLRNLRGRIVLKKTAPDIAVVIDDMMTTGSTLDVCAAALKAGGAKKVYGLCLFYR
jgi:ComF family protein